MKKGYYWVQIGDEIEVAKYDGDRFHCIGRDWTLSDLIVKPIEHIKKPGGSYEL